ncbi:hydrolase [Clostridium botulinum]|uniref:alpha/beta hydrolase n=1 Tax=Clostridium botulinum TaxID=1491 RepID=UPI00099D1987|nr:alpha/beta hydrolase [Clostridium botulinum]NFA97793.1 alpha/beta hydrolase [Clostridium botulinum]NFB51746.1 alpha/beta hydrolase [Clostridium botulinum]NFC76330.1 alpha/beta hydrolase [Clostridium botulinum]NFC88725.1 alpha/beta hydrolase [Clostridium botulinum]NFD05616.1 alpha/beta hydrolase [Clostridium botulinum]
MYHTANIKNTKTKKYKILFLIPILIILIAINAIGFYNGNLIYVRACIEPTSRNSTNMYDTYKSTFDERRFNTLKKENITINSKYGYTLKGTYMENPHKTKNSVVIVHGIRSSRWESMKYADLYLDKGFNILIYDSRYHGLSGGSDVTYGYYEKYDLDQCIDWLERKNPGGIIGAHGESLGASTILLHSKMNLSKNRVKFYVADCPYSNLEELLKNKLNEELHINNKIITDLLLFYSGACALLKSKFLYSSVSPIDSIKTVQTPIMFIHGDKDIYIPKKMSEEMYNIKPGIKEIYIAPNAGHAQAYLYNKKEYRKNLYKFIDKYVKIN